MRELHEECGVFGAWSPEPQNMADLARMIGLEKVCHACFSGEYPTGIPTHTEKDRFEGKLSQRRTEHENN